MGGLAALVLLLVLVAFFLPRNYRVERAAVVNARPEVVFAQLDGMIGPDFEKGLSTLKALCETGGK